MDVTTRDGVRLALHPLEVGSGPRFLLIHGFAQNRMAFTLGPLPRLLAARGASVYVAELRGHGKSQSSQGHTLADHLDLDLPALIDAVGPPVHLIGHSMGGVLGYALLARGRLASLTTFGAPILLGRGRVLIRLAALLAEPLGRGRSIPMHHFLALLARPLSKRTLLQRFTRLASPSHAAPSALRTILENADPESPHIFREMARMSRIRSPELAGVDLLEAVRKSEVPVATIVGQLDVFGGRPGVKPMDEPGHAGRRLVVEIPGATHIDITIGHHLPETVAKLWPFLLEAADA